MDLIEVRAYLRCKAAYDAEVNQHDNKQLEPWRDTKTLERVMDTTRALVMERMGKKPGGHQRRGN